MRWKSKKSMEIISNAHACTREWTHEKSWHRENLPPSWNHPVSSISLYPTPLRKKKKKTRDVVFTNVFGLSSSSTTKMTRNRMRGNWVLATGNRTDVSLSLLFFVSTLFATRFLPSIRILTSKENFISRFKRNIRNLYIHKQAN